MKDRAPTYSEIMATARRAAQEIEQEWPEWKKALSPRPMRERPDDDGRREPSDESQK